MTHTADLSDQRRGAAEQSNDEFDAFKILFSILDPSRDSHRNFEYHLRKAVNLARSSFEHPERILHSTDFSPPLSSNFSSLLDADQPTISSILQPASGNSAASGPVCDEPHSLGDSPVPTRPLKMARTRAGARRSLAVFALEDADAGAIAAFSPTSAPILGSGAHGTVYALCAADSRMAVKAVRCRAARSGAIAREVSLLSLPRHPSVASLLAVRIDHEEGDGGLGPAGGGGGGDSVVMLGYELAAGGSLDAAVGGGRRAEYGAVVDGVAQVLRGLHHLHTVARVAHHDIKPANLLLFPPPGGGAAAAGRLKICDFGSCWPMGAVCEGAAGTPLYMSPTQVMLRKERIAAGVGPPRAAVCVRRAPSDG